MKFKKSLVKMIVIGSIFFITSISSAGLISLQDESLNNFWTVSKLDMSFINTSYAESGGGESGGKESGGSRSYKKESGGYIRPVITPIVENIYVEPVQIVEKKKVVLTDSEIISIQARFDKVYNIIDKKYNSDFQKLNIYKKLNTLLEEKILSLELIKINIENEELLKKYEKKILLFKKLNILAQENILTYIDSIDLNFEVTKKEKVIKAKNIILENANIKKAKNIKIAEAKRLEDLRMQIEQAKIVREKKLAEEIAVEKVRLAKIESDRLKAIAVEKAIIAAQKVAEAKVDTNTSAS